MLCFELDRMPLALLLGGWRNSFSAGGILHLQEMKRKTEEDAIVAIVALVTQEHERSKTGSEKVRLAVHAVCEIVARASAGCQTSSVSHVVRPLNGVRLQCLLFLTTAIIPLPYSGNERANKCRYATIDQSAATPRSILNKYFHSLAERCLHSVEPIGTAVLIH